MIGMVWLNGGGLFLSPFGSADRRLRPEPIAFSAPRKNGPPFMLDMTMTVVAGGKIEQKNIRNEPMPDGWVIDQQGNYVTDPMRYKEEPENTGVLPLGGMQFGHKGYGLGMMVEMIVGPLSYAGCTKDAKGSGGGVMILAINIEDFIDLASYEQEVEDLAQWVCSARPLPGVKKVYAPGEIEQESYARLVEEGIDLPEPTWQAIGEVAKEMGVEMPSL
jgi:LDH2 family malate/lactate/ureidoglycolate dehydrogenase